MQELNSKYVRNLLRIKFLVGTTNIYTYKYTCVSCKYATYCIRFNYELMNKLQSVLCKLFFAIKNVFSYN